MLSVFRTKNVFEEEAKFIYDRIASTEKCLAEFCSGFARYSRKAARLRDKTDELVQVLATCAQLERLDESLASGLTNVAGTLAAIADCGDLRTANIEKRVVAELAKYESVCKRAKDETRQILGACERELARKRQLDRIKERNPNDREQIIRAETELVKATSEVTKTLHNVEDKIVAFQRQKLDHLQEILRQFVLSEIAYHAKAIEQLSAAYKHVEAIDKRADLENFRKYLRATKFSTPKRIPFGLTRSLGSLTAPKPICKTHRSPGIPNSHSVESFHNQPNNSDSDKPSTSEPTKEEDNDNVQEEEEEEDSFRASKNYFLNK